VTDPLVIATLFGVVFAGLYVLIAGAAWAARAVIRRRRIEDAVTAIYTKPGRWWG
jgi:hypothetical protein